MTSTTLRKSTPLLSKSEEQPISYSIDCVFRELTEGEQKEAKHAEVFSLLCPLHGFDFCRLFFNSSCVRFPSAIDAQRFIKRYMNPDAQVNVENFFNHPNLLMLFWLLGPSFGVNKFILARLPLPESFVVEAPDCPLEKLKLLEDLDACIRTPSAIHTAKLTWTDDDTFVVTCEAEHGVKLKFVTLEFNWVVAFLKYYVDSWKKIKFDKFPFSKKSILLHHF